MLDGIASLPLASEQEFLAAPRMVPAGESYLRSGLEVYAEVTPAELYRILTRHRDDVLDLLDAPRQWMAAHPEMVHESL